MYVILEPIFHHLRFFGFWGFVRYVLEFLYWGRGRGEGDGDGDGDGCEVFLLLLHWFRKKHGLFRGAIIFIELIYPPLRFS